MPSSIKLISADNVEVGTIPANSEEPFTLETLETLIDDHHKERKSFILARVETRDPALPKRSAFHYYAAHHLNKVIFRKYGPKCEYLFRLCALNPMTNTEIVGDVKYFMVDREATMVRSNRTSSHSALRGKRESRLVSMSNLMRSSIGLKKSDIKIAEISGPDAMLNDENARSSLPDIRRSSILNSSNSQQSVLKITADSRIQPTNVPMVMNSELETPLEEKEGEELGQNGLRRDTLSKNIRFAQDLPNGKLQNLNTTRKTSKSHNMLFQRQSAAPFADSKRYHSMGAIKNANTDCVKMTIRRKSLSILQPIKSLEKEKERVAPRIKFTEWMNISGSQYKAVFIGTDDDYLQKSHIRQLFEINMADGESSQLFDIPREVLEAEGRLNFCFR